MSTYVYTAGEIADRARHNPEATFVLASDYDALAARCAELEELLRDIKSHGLQSFATGESEQALYARMRAALNAVQQFDRRNLRQSATDVEPLR